MQSVFQNFDKGLQWSVTGLLGRGKVPPGNKHGKLRDL